MTYRRPHPAFTVIELLVVLAIIGIVLALTLAAVQHVRTAAIRAQCLNNLRQIGIALHQYHDAQGAFPPGMSYQQGKDPYLYMGWEPRILPYLEQEALWHQAQQAYAEYPYPFYYNNPPHLMFTVVPLFGCPADPRYGRPGNLDGYPVALTWYLGVEGRSNRFIRRNGVLYRDSHVRITDITDGTSTTIMVGERPPSPDSLFGFWYASTGQNNDGSGAMLLSAQERNYWYPSCPAGPYSYGPGNLNNLCDTFHFWSLHPGGGHFLFADGSVHFLTYGAASVLPAMATRDGGEAVEPPE
jgi:prepilin-type N-terminal cleavage/methylation domain-containing protein/prepilin-type processing-associated H-X9-DG protein